MCGITGWVSFDRDLTEERPVVTAMTDTLSRRGPDGSGVWTAGHAALGHHRLAVLDPQHGGQPLVAPTPHGPVALTYSGETYNFAELRAELSAAGHRFRTSCDTEVVLAGYLAWGLDVVERLNGMYAFAVWDARVERLVLVRDRLGIKPLYYWPTSDGLLFGSEAKSVFAHPLARPVLDTDGLREMIAHSLSLDLPVWAGLRHVPPGAVVTVDRDGPRTRHYWRLTTREHRDGTRETVDTIGDLLRDSVHRQLIADVPVCMLLSGGLDSSTMTALAATRPGASGEAVTTYSVDFADHTGMSVDDRERPDADAPFVREVVKQLSTHHTEVLLDADEIAGPDLRRETVAVYDLPPGSQDRDRSMYLLFREIRRRCTVALSGESADELFGGYHWNHDPRLQRTADFPWIAGLDDYGQLRSALRPELSRSLEFDAYLRDLYASAVAEVEHLPDDSALERRMRVSSHLHLTRMLRVLLERKDRLSMAVGLEVRVPYCDHRLVEYVHNTPWRLKCHDGREKSLLRAVGRDLLPESVLRRRKSAYPTLRAPRHTRLLQEAAAQLLREPGRPVFDLVAPRWLAGAVRTAPAALPAAVRNGIEDVLNLDVWLDLYKPELRVR
ncbi:asparagine synthase (glutamine-hydrolyzing) [Streptomyces sp. NPDC052012]|uniref:asparagine synthase (glutamine-hydrolyzing) n=1 Tax=Streptomyces sp. NPDC052012 TaxID=3155051 RepID=UPI00344BCA7F